MRRYIYGLALVFGVLAACEQVEQPAPPTPLEPQTPSGPREVEYVATIERAFTKTSVEGTKVLWSAGDSVTVMHEGVAQTFAVAEDCESARFPKMTVQHGTPTYAFYPAALAAKFSPAADSTKADGLSFVVPAVQDGSFAKANISVACSLGDTLEFKNLCGLLRFEVLTDEERTVVIKGLRGETLAGGVKVSFIQEETPGIAVEHPVDSVTVMVSGKGIYYAALLPLAALKGYEVRVLNASSDVIYESQSRNLLHLTRSTVQNMGDICSELIQMDWFVTPEGSGDKDGRTWESAISYQQMGELIALNRKAESGTGNTSTGAGSLETSYLIAHKEDHASMLQGAAFYLAAGEYSTEQYVRISFPDQGEMIGISIYGGYDPSSAGADLSRRDPATHKTIIHGASVSGTKRAFYVQDYVDLTFDGISFEGGTGDSTTGGGILLYRPDVDDAQVNFVNCGFSGNSAGCGGAISQRRGKLVLKDCVFTKNKATTGSGVSTAQGGGCIYVGGEKNAAAADNTEIVIDNCLFTENDSRYTGAVMTFRGTKCSMTDVKVEDNKSGYSGTVALYCGDAEVLNCSFKSNVIEHDYGAAILTYANPLTVRNSDFTGNIAKTFGGAVAIYGGTTNIIDGCKFTGNSATQRNGNVYGGAIYVSQKGTTLNVDGATFTDNKVSNSYVSAEGKANTSAFGGSITANTGTFLNVRNTAFLRSKADTVLMSGGAVSLHAGAVCTLENVTVSGCSVKGTGGAIYSSMSTLVLKGSTVSECYGVAGGAIYLSGDAVAEVYESSFDKNTSPDGGCFGNDGKGSMLYVNECLFTGNKATNYGGVFRGATHGKTGAFFNNCRFRDNILTQNNTGSCLYMKTGYLCVNNCSFYDNANVNNYGRELNWSNPSNSDGKTYDTGGIVLNCTFYNDGPSQAIGVDAVRDEEYVLILNNVITNTGNKAILTTASSTLFGGYNIHTDYSTGNLGAYETVADLSKSYAGATDLLVDTETVHVNHNATTDILTLKSDMMTSKISFNQLTKSMLAAKITGTSAANYDENMVNFGERFHTWLTVTLPASGYKDGLKNDIAGKARPTGDVKSYWPGCCQGN